MLFVLPAVLFWGLFALAVWFFFFRKTVHHEKTVEEAKRRSAEFEQLLAKNDEPLHCLGCQISFPGPLPERGCPKCNTQAMVIPVQTSTDPLVCAAPIVPLSASAAPAPTETAPLSRIGWRQ